MSSDKAKKYELVLEGFENESPQSIQKVKGILIGDMELTIPEVQKILESFPLTIKRSETELDLSVHYKSLKAAGAKVLLLKKEEQQEEKSSNEIEFKLDNSAFEIKKEEDTEEQNTPKAEEVTEEIEFELSLEDLEKAQPIKKENAPGSYELNLDENSEDLLKDLEKELGTSLEIADFSLDLQPVTGVMELIDSPAEANTPIDSGSWEPERLSESLVAETSHNLSNEILAAKPEAPVTPTKAPDMAGKISKIEASLLELKTEASPPPTEVKKAPAEVIPELKVEEKSVEPVVPAKKSQERIELPKAEVTPSSPAPQTIHIPKTKAKAKRYTIPNDLLISIIVGGILLGVVNWFYFSGKEAQKAATTPKIVVPDIVDSPPANEEKAPEAPLFDFAGETSNEMLTSRLELSANIDKAIVNSIEITTPQPADLTPEEIVNNIPPRIWLKKAEGRISGLEKDTEGNFSGKVQLKMYFEQGQSRDRIVGDATVKIIPNGNTINAAITISPNEKLNSEIKYEIGLNKIVEAADAPEVSEAIQVTGSAFNTTEKP